MGRQAIAADPETVEALAIFGGQLRAARNRRRWTLADAAMRCGVSARTLAQLERGAPQVAIGHAFHAALVLEVPLFGLDSEGRQALAGAVAAQVALLPRRTRAISKNDDDDF